MIAFTIAILIIPVGLIVYALLPNVLHPLNRKGEAVFDDYRIKVLPSYHGDAVRKDSCILIIADNNKPSVQDTLVFYPRFAQSLNILISENHKWNFVYDAGDVRCTSNFIKHERINSIDLNGVQNVLVLDVLDRYGCIQLLQYEIDSQPPYYSKKLYRSRGIKFKRTMREVAKAQVNKLNLEWLYTDIYNYLLVSNEKGVVTDTIRWGRSSLGNTFEFLMVGDTIVLDGHHTSRPTCTSPLVIKRELNLTGQYPKGYKEAASTREETRHPATLIFLNDYRSLFTYWGEIKVSTIYLPSSPLDGRNVTEDFMSKKVFLVTEE